MHLKLTEIAQELDTLGDFLRFGTSLFNRHGLYFGHGTTHAADDALVLLLHALHLSPGEQDRFLGCKLTRDEKQQVLSLFAERAFTRTPVPYLTHEAFFCDLPFYVDKRVLIPRSPIAEVIQKGFKPFYQGEDPENILDLCTGSGCIGIACALHFEQAQVVLADLSADALAVAHINVERFDLDDQVTCIQSDLFAGIHGRFDLIVANPPYVDREDMADLPEEYRHEPAMALASGEQGLDHPLAILQQASHYLTETGWLVMEVGNSWGHLEHLLPELDFNWIELQRGGHGVMAISRYELEMYRATLDRAS